MSVIAFLFGLLTTFVQPAPAQKPNEPGFAGAEACVQCHKTNSTQVTKTAHVNGSGCESCHGPGQAHVDGMRAARGDDDRIQAATKLIFAFKSSSAENSKRCLTCHVTNHEQALFNRSEHQLQGVSCQTCHSAHLTQADKAIEQRWLGNKLLRAPEATLCFSCHKVVQGQFALPNHHKVPEGLMKCTDCHNAHGTRNQPMLRKTNWETCVSCHAEKRGPFVFEHASVKVEGCATCHSPHGTVSRMMLLRREDRFLCLQCHVNPNADNVPHGRLGFQTRGDCIRCHASIHGSNFNPFFLH